MLSQALIEHRRFVAKRWDRVHQWLDLQPRKIYWAGHHAQQGDDRPLLASLKSGIHYRQRNRALRRQRRAMGDPLWPTYRGVPDEFRKELEALRPCEACGGGRYGTEACSACGSGTFSDVP